MSGMDELFGYYLCDSQHGREEKRTLLYPSNGIGLGWVSLKGQYVHFPFTVIGKSLFSSIE